MKPKYKIYQFPSRRYAPNPSGLTSQTMTCRLRRAFHLLQLKQEQMEKVTVNEEGKTGD